MFLGYQNDRIAFIAETRDELENLPCVTLDKIEETDKTYFLHNGSYVCEVPIEEQNEEIRATREQLYIQTSDKLKADYDEAVARGAENVEELKTAWLESKDKIREENPYVVESAEDDVTVEEVQVEDETLSVEPEIGADEAEAVEESEAIEDGL